MVVGGEPAGGCVSGGENGCGVSILGILSQIEDFRRSLRVLCWDDFLHL